MASTVGNTTRSSNEDKMAGLDFIRGSAVRERFAGALLIRHTMRVYQTTDGFAPRQLARGLHGTITCLRLELEARTTNQV